MDRRSYLQRAAIAGLVGSAVLGGCVESPTHEPADEPIDTAGTPQSTPPPIGKIESEWHHGVGGTVDAVVGDRVFGRENWSDDDSEGGVFALGVGTGEHLWSYGKTGGFHQYTDLTVTDALYFGLGDDAGGSGTGETYALEFDGKVRWTAMTGSVYERPRVTDGVVFVGSDDGVVRAFDAVGGDVRWSNGQAPGDSPTVDVVGVSDAVYTIADELIALERDNGDVRWRYGNGDDRIRTPLIADGMAYVADGRGVAAVADGEERWRTPMDGNKWISGLESERLLVRKGWDLHAFDVATGEEEWVATDHEELAVDAFDGTVYIGSDELIALDARDGTEIWCTTVGDGEPVQAVTAVTDDRAGGHSLFVQYADNHLDRIDADGDVTWRESVAGRIQNVLVNGAVFIGSTQGVYARELS